MKSLMVIVEEKEKVGLLWCTGEGERTSGYCGVGGKGGVVKMGEGQ